MKTFYDADTVSRQYARSEGYAAGLLNPGKAVNPYKTHDAGLAVPLAQSWQLGYDIARIEVSKAEAKPETCATGRERGA